MIVFLGSEQADFNLIFKAIFFFKLAWLSTINMFLSIFIMLQK